MRARTEPSTTGLSDLQVRRVERQRQVHRPTGRFHIGGKAHVVFHVAGAAFGDPALALELFEQLAGRFADDVDQHVQAAAMGHADHDFPHPWAPDSWMISSIIGIRLSPPSSEKRFWPT
jgi:hypothetical protein